MEVLLRVPITYTGRDGAAVHAPMVMGRFGATETRLVLDTGSEVHLVNQDLAEALNLSLDPGEEGVDHSGTTMPSWNVGSVPLTIGNYDVELTDVVAIPAPPPFPPKGISGILSPQHLHRTAWTVIDMAANELQLVDDADEPEIAGFLAERSPELGLVRLGRDQAQRSVVVRAAIEPHDEIPALLNTGGKRTQFAASAVPSFVADAVGRIGGGVSGADVAGSLVGEATLVIGGSHLRVPELAIRPQMHDPQGIVGMDVLKGAVLACAADVTRPVFLLLPAS